jgi:FkbM family methyltransferase
MRKFLKDFILPKKNEVQEKFGNRYYSQCGEDAIVKYIFRLRNIDHPSYIDVGAHHPYYLSNTAYFYEKGCRGINIEANPDLIEAFQIHRPKDINLNVAIGGAMSEMDFYILSDSSLSTFSKDEAEKLVSGGRHEIISVKKIQLITLESVLQQYSNNVFPDFLSLDVEGLDMEILKSIDFSRYWPKVICLEAAEYSPIGAGIKRLDLIDYIADKGYYEYANTNLNSILVKNEFWFI